VAPYHGVHLIETHVYCSCEDLDEASSLDPLVLQEQAIEALNDVESEIVRGLKFGPTNDVVPFSPCGILLFQGRASVADMLEIYFDGYGVLRLG
jgi:hypothetical protein